jgi:hypothetical protein
MTNKSGNNIGVLLFLIQSRYEMKNLPQRFFFSKFGFFFCVRYLHQTRVFLSSPLGKIKIQFSPAGQQKKLEMYAFCFSYSQKQYVKRELKR